MSYITFLLLFFKSFYFSKQLHSAKVFNNQQFNLLHFIHNTYHFYTLFTFIIHKIQLFTIQQPKLAKLYHKMAVQILSKKIFQGCTHPFQNSFRVYPRTPLGHLQALIFNRLQHRNGRYRVGYTLKKYVCRDFLLFGAVTY